MPESMQAKSESELNCEIVNVKKREFISKLDYLRMRISGWFSNLPVWSFLKLNKNYVAEIKALLPDMVWVYPYQLIRISKQFESIPLVVTCCDSASLHYYRKLGDINYSKDKATYKNYRKYLNLESRYLKQNVLFHLVGLEDLKFLQRLLYPNVEKAFFLPHPHYSFIKKTTYFTAEKIKILISGQYNEYVKTDFDRLLNLLLQNKDLISEITITFIGKNWNVFSQQLQKCGYESTTITWVEEYFSEIINYDIQLFPTSLGTGTKGKVLDALCCGLICIGSKYAFENIMVQNGESCLQYNSVEEVPDIIHNVINQKEFYIKLASLGQSTVIEKHSPELISSLFFRKIFND
ncbi:MAG: hypothetical protein LBJ72_11495 [Dysgonamonadaceae bacterium]|nr:hypothetical protein [Dysgonamonadaceae bacterium]